MTNCAKNVLGLCIEDSMCGSFCAGCVDGDLKVFGYVFSKYFTSSDPSLQYRASDGGGTFDFYQTGVTNPTFNFKNSAQSTTTSVLSYGYSTASGSNNSTIASTQSNTSNGTAAGAGYRVINDTGETLEIGVTSSGNTGLHGIKRPYIEGINGLDVRATGTGKTIKLWTDTVTRGTWNDNGLGIGTTAANNNPLVMINSRNGESTLLNRNLTTGVNAYTGIWNDADGGSSLLATTSTTYSGTAGWEANQVIHYSNNTSGGQAFIDSGTGPFKFKQGAIQIARIDNTGLGLLGASSDSSHVINASKSTTGGMDIKVSNTHSGSASAGFNATAENAVSALFATSGGYSGVTGGAANAMILFGSSTSGGMIFLQDSTNDFIFKQNNTEIARFTNSGFSILGTSFTTSATFLPTAVGLSVAGTATYNLRLGQYNITGRLLTIWININWTAHTGSGRLSIEGLPYSSTGDYYLQVNEGVVRWNDNGTYKTPFAYNLQTTNNLIFDNPDGTGLSVGNNLQVFFITISYLI